jgi:HD-GYP domain-containing protein (c-di-GMP phosphodiesterase class II)
LKKILLVDDQESILEILQIYIEANFNEVETVLAYGGFEACEILEKEEIDFIICDYRMPEGNGKVVYSCNYTHKALPFAWHSATFDIDSKNVPTQDKFETFVLSKPVDFDELITCIEKMSDIEKVSDDKPRKIRIDILNEVENITAEIFIPLDSGKLFKINKAGESFDKVRLEKYQQKGVEFFYISHQAYENIVNSRFESFQKMIDECGTLEDVYFVTDAVVDSFAENAKKLTIDETDIKLAASCATGVLKKFNLDMNLKKKISGVVDKSSYVSGHAMILIHYATAIKNKLPDSYDVDLEEIAKAAILHDVLLKNDRLAMITDPTEKNLKLTLAESNLVKNHGEMLIDSVPEGALSDNVVKMIRYHHELDIPKLSKSNITDQFFVFLISHQMAHLTYTNDIDTAIEWLLYLDEGEFPIADDIRKAFKL